MVLATKCLDNIILLYLCLTISTTCWKARFSSRAFSELLTSHGNFIANSHWGRPSLTLGSSLSELCNMLGDVTFVLDWIARLPLL